MILKYWGPDRAYHHTAPISMIYALREALRVVLEEGLEKRWERHLRVHDSLVRGLGKLGLSMLVEKPYRAPMINTVVIPEGVNDRRPPETARRVQLNRGDWISKGKVWRSNHGGFLHEENAGIFSAPPKTPVAPVVPPALKLQKGGDPDEMLSLDEIKVLTENQEGLCVSLFMPPSYGIGNPAEPIRFRTC
jgi:hypothetical protein